MLLIILILLVATPFAYKPPKQVRTGGEAFNLNMFKPTNVYTYRLKTLPQQNIKTCLKISALREGTVYLFERPLGAQMYMPQFSHNH